MWALTRWWYGAGWLGELELQARRLSRVESYFDFRSLILTLFNPFRQIDAGARRGGLAVQLRALVDSVISRLVGALARITLLFIGVVWWLVSLVFSVGWLIIWPFLPLSPLLGFVGMIAGVGSV